MCGGAGRRPHRPPWARRRTLDNQDAELAIIFDLALHTARKGGTRAIDRCARSRAKRATPEEALVLAGLCAARFSLFRVTGRSWTVGFLLEDVMRGGTIRLLHDGLEGSAKPDEAVALRVAAVDGFHIACGPIVPVPAGVAEGLVRKVTEEERSAMADNPNFATIVYRTSIRFGVVRTLRVDESIS